MNRFGICNYDMDGYEPKIENLEIFNNYYEALGRYLGLKLNSDGYDSFTDSDLWLVYINENNLIVQFEQLSWDIKCKLVEINNENT
jgi:hypothetical protein